MRLYRACEQTGGSSLESGRSGRFGFVHSEQTGSAVDGPGLRTVFWLAGCALRCLYCQNPDTWKLDAGRRVSVEELITEVRKYARFTHAAGGGITLSGGEPLVQQAFCLELFRQAHELGVHTALDTNGFLGHRLADEDLEHIDLVLLDLKSFDSVTHLRVTGQRPEPVLRFARRLSDLERPTWVRFVLVPGVTDDPDNVGGLARFCASLSNVQRVEVLPFHQLGRHKWQALGVPYALDAVLPPTHAELETVRRAFRREGLSCPSGQSVEQKTVLTG
jgi:pyruvate formate lyase activating enzyme